MGMTYVDVDVLEQIIVNMNDVLNHLLECEGTLKQQLSQMQTESVELDVYLEWGNVKQYCEEIIMEVVVIREDIEQMIAVVETIPDDYKDLENRYTALVQQIGIKMNNIQALLDGAATIDYPVNMESDIIEEGRNVEQDITNAMTTMEMSNLNAITRTLEDEYSYEKVIPNVPKQEMDI